LDAIVDTNVKGLVYVSQVGSRGSSQTKRESNHRFQLTFQAVIPGMRQRNRGHIIDVGSISGREVYQGGGIYCGSKFFEK
jgi:NADP-dependent 3-hydroxy acid dehydrogenase YdfG